jgi:hypothetical protein
MRVIILYLKTFILSINHYQLDQTDLGLSGSGPASNRFLYNTLLSGKRHLANGPPFNVNPFLPGSMNLE